MKNSNSKGRAGAKTGAKLGAKLGGKTGGKLGGGGKLKGKAREFFGKIKLAFQQAEQHRKEKAAQRKAYREGKEVKEKPQTRERLEKAELYIKEARLIAPPVPEKQPEKYPDMTLQPKQDAKTRAVIPARLMEAGKSISAYIEQPADSTAQKGLENAKLALAEFDSKGMATGGVITAVFLLILFVIISKS